MKKKKKLGNYDRVASNRGRSSNTLLYVFLTAFVSAHCAATDARQDRQALLNSATPLRTPVGLGPRTIEVKHYDKPPASEASTHAPTGSSLPTTIGASSSSSSGPNGSIHSSRISPYGSPSPDTDGRLDVGKQGWIDFIDRTTRDIVRNIERDPCAINAMGCKYRDLGTHAMLRANIAEILVKVDSASHVNTLRMEFSERDLEGDDASWWETITRKAIDEIKTVLHVVDRSTYDGYHRRQPQEEAYGGLLEITRHWIIMAIRSWELSRYNTQLILAQLGHQLKLIDKGVNADGIGGEALHAMRNLHQFMSAELRASVHFEKTSFDFRRFVERFLEAYDEDRESELGEDEGLSDDEFRERDLKIVTAPTSLNTVSNEVYFGPGISDHAGGPIAWVADQVVREMQNDAPTARTHSSGFPADMTDGDTCSLYTSDSGTVASEEDSRPTFVKGRSFDSWGSARSAKRMREAFERLMNEAAKQVKRAVTRTKRDGPPEVPGVFMNSVETCPLHAAGMTNSCYDCIAGPGIFPRGQTRPSDSLQQILPTMTLFPCDKCWKRQLEYVESNSGRSMGRDDWERMGVYKSSYQRPAAVQAKQVQATDPSGYATPVNLMGQFDKLARDDSGDSRKTDKSLNDSRGSDRPTTVSSGDSQRYDSPLESSPVSASSVSAGPAIIRNGASAHSQGYPSSQTSAATGRRQRQSVATGHC